MAMKRHKESTGTRKEKLTKKALTQSQEDSQVYHLLYKRKEEAHVHDVRQKVVYRTWHVTVLRAHDVIP